MNIQETIDQYNQAREAMRQVTQAGFVNLFQPFFQANPDVEAIVWNQYTPWFNDGDTCIFSVNDPAIRSAKLFPDADSYHGENCCDAWDAGEEYKPMFDTLREIFGKVPDQMFLDLFEDHVEVTIERNGQVQVDEYEHD